MLESLPKHLRERTRSFDEKTANKVDAGAGETFVLYWMRTAFRTDENPALDVAWLLAKKQDLPLLVYHAISEHYEYASDRHHTFMLQGARDVQAKFAELGGSYAFHLATGDDRNPHLMTLTNMARGNSCPQLL